MTEKGEGAVLGSVGGGGSFGFIGAMGGGMGTTWRGEPVIESTSDRVEQVDSLLTRRRGGGGWAFFGRPELPLLLFLLLLLLVLVAGGGGCGMVIE